MKNKNLLVAVVLLVAILALGVGFAAISTVTLQVNGLASATSSDSNFTVKFTGTPTKGQYCTAAEISSSDPLAATMTVSGMDTKNQVATCTFTITNASAELGAKLAVTVTDNNLDSNFFKVEPTLSSTSVAAGGTATLTVKVTLLKSPVDDISAASFKIKVTADATQA